jgi:hypothetical protein
MYIVHEPQQENYVYFTHVQKAIKKGQMLFQSWFAIMQNPI